MSDSELPELPLAAQLEALLFVSAEPVAPAELSAALEITVKQVEVGLLDLEASLTRRGLCLQRHGGTVQLTTAPSLAANIVW